MVLIKKENQSECGAPYLAHLKPKTNQVSFIIEFRSLNKQLKLKPYTMPNINKLFLQSEGFKPDTSTNLNMGYYHI